MHQHLDPQHTLPQRSQMPPYHSAADQTVSKTENAVVGAFASLSTAGQKTVGDYFAHIERGLPPSTSPFSSFEREETLRELQAHLLSLIVAYQELGDDEPKAIASAMAQFGAARMVSGGLRHVQRRNDHGVSPALVVPLLLFSLALLMPIAMELYYLPFFRIAGQAGWNTIGLFGWPGLILLPFVAGAFGASRKEEHAKRDLLLGMGLVVGTAVLMSFAFTEPIQTSPALFSEMRSFVVQASCFWLVSAALGTGFVRGMKVSQQRKQPIING